jgi:protein-S-isoprenylcysteine O-methyltransferase Ste14
MGLLFLGIFGLVLLFVYDLASLKKMKYRVVFAAGGYLAHALAIFGLLFGERSLNLPKWAAYPGALLALAGLGWLAYCLFFFPPIKKTYTEANEMALATGGPYSLSRHPGFLGYIALMAGLVLLSGSAPLFRAGLFWTLLNLLLITVQDKWIFPELFSRYKEYRLNTPMIFPTRKSLARFRQTLIPDGARQAGKEVERQPWVHF